MTPFESIIGLALPVDGPAWIALIVGLGALLVPLIRWSKPIPWPVWVGSWAALSALISLGYVHYYLQGGPRIIDATSYWLEARGFASGLVSWPVDEPSASFRGRFLLHHGNGDGPLRMGVIFPPGYPGLLSLGFLVGAPLLIGPIIAATLSAVTAILARVITNREEVGRIAVVLSTLNACLRYHTADTMSHGFAALLLAGSAIAILRGMQTSKWAWWMLSGLLSGWLAATRPATALAAYGVGVPVVLWWVFKHRKVSVLCSLLGVIPPLILLFLHQYSVTGEVLSSVQASYYRLADGPPGCFRYGFGEGIGCLVEHGPYVRSVAPDGYGLSAALVTTGRRLYLHLADILNYAPFAILCFAGVVARSQHPSTYIVALMPVALTAAYAPFYFDGSYPGGGARMLADALPFEQTMIAVALAYWARTFRNHRQGFRWSVAVAVGLSAWGFAFHGSHMHRKLRDRDNGRPLFEENRFRAMAGENASGLLFVDTDHGFNLAFDPAARDASKSLMVARARFDARDSLLWERVGKPSAWRYINEPWAADPKPPRLIRWDDHLADELARNMRGERPYRFEAEADWPALAQRGGYAAPTPLPQGCVSQGSVLALHRVASEAESEACVSGSFMMPDDGLFELRAWIVAQGKPVIRMWVDVGETHQQVASPSVGKKWPVGITKDGGRCCFSIGQIEIQSHAYAPGRWTLCTTDAWLGIDRIELNGKNPHL